MLTKSGGSRRSYQPINGNDIATVEIETEKSQSLSLPESADFNFRNLVLGFLTIVVVLLFILWLRPSIRDDIENTSYNYTVSESAPNSVNTNDITVNITQGSLLGKRLKTRDGIDYLAFLGIPYAKPPVNELRFKPPQPADGWTGIRNATYFRSECTQDGRQGGWRGIKGHEDCLYLNVYTPKTVDQLHGKVGAKNTFPVMVYFHGGGLAGNVFYNGGEYLMDENVTLVTLHYRLGVFGMLNVHTSAARGHQGLKDQAMALSWVQSNIAAFGGDPARVLLFGESSGSSSITAHLVSPMSKGLFSRVICESGTILDTTLISLNPVQDAFNLGRKLNCSSSEPHVEGLMDCLMNTEAEKLVVTTAEAFTDRSFLYSVESSDAFEGEEAFLPDTPLKLYQSGFVSNVVPAMFGVNNQEGISASLSLLKFPAIMDAWNVNWTQQAMSGLHLLPNPNNFTTEPEKIVQAIHDFYFGAGNNLTLDVSQNITDMFSDRDFTHPTHLTAFYVHQAYEQQRQSRGSKNGNNVYLYYLTEQVPQSYWVEVFSQLGFNGVSIDDVKGVGHVDELQYLFQDAGYNYPAIPPGAPQYNFSKMLVHLWTSFADTGVPDTSGYGEEWTPISGSKPFEWYEIHGNRSKMTGILSDRINFWDSFAVTDLYI